MKTLISGITEERNPTMGKEDLERLLKIIQSSTEEIPNGKDEWGETEYIKVIDADVLEKEVQKWMKEIETKEKVSRMIEIDENE